MTSPPSDPSSKKESLKKEVEKEQEHMKEKEKGNGKLRTGIRIFKISAVMLTSVSAAITGITNNVNIAYFTFAAGFLTTIAEFTEKEFKANSVRAHAKLYGFRYTKLIENLEFNPDDKDINVLIKETLKEFQDIRDEEASTRPTLKD